MNKKVLITVSGGIASAFAEQGVDVVIIDFDDFDDADSVDDISPIHNDFLPLILHSCETVSWPSSNEGRINDAEIIKSPEFCSEFTISFKDLSIEFPPIDKPVLCKMSDFVLGARLRILSLKYDNSWLATSAGACHYLPFRDVDQWAFLPEAFGDCHVD